jgi:hypothetical protein
MIKVVLVGLWVCVVTLASSYTAASFKADAGPDAKKDFLDGLNYERTGVITVPMLADGAVQGYVTAEFVFTADSRRLAKLSVPPHSFVVDEAFREIYGDPQLDFRHLEKVDMKALAAHIRDNVNARLQSNLLIDVLVGQFNYVSKDDIKNEPA